MRAHHLCLEWLARAMLVASVAGCATTRVHSGKPPGMAAGRHDNRWHPALLFGLVPLKPPYDLNALCPQGWAEIRSGQDPFTLMASVMTVFLYTPSRVTIVCAQRSDFGPPALPHYPVPQAQ